MKYDVSVLIEIDKTYTVEARSKAEAKDKAENIADRDFIYLPVSSVHAWDAEKIKE